MNTPTNVYGFEAIQFAVGFVITYTESIISKLEDKKLSWLERLHLVMELAPVLDVLKHAKQIELEFNDLSDSERNELIVFISKEFDLSNTKAKIRVIASLNLLSALMTLIKGD